MALEIQQRQTQYGYRRHHTRYEIENGRVVLRLNPIKNGGITQPDLQSFIEIVPIWRFIRHSVSFFFNEEFFKQTQKRKLKGFKKDSKPSDGDIGYVKC